MTDPGVAIVTGGASGLGLATTRALAELGCTVFALDLPHADPAAASAAGGQLLVADVTDEVSVAEAVRTAAAAGPLRVVVNCAGVGTPGRVLGSSGPLPLEAFSRIVAINLIGTFNVLRLGAAAMAENEPIGGERGVIINTASAAAFDGQAGQVAYAASKGGVAAMTLPLARDLARHLIRAVTIAPGLFDTPLLQTLPEAARTSLETQVPMPSRLGDPAEFAALVVHVVQNQMLNGEVIRLDGALRMAAR